LSGESDYALVGGTNLNLNPEVFIAESKARMLSPTNRCHTFDEDADGYVRGEGACMILLKPLSKAISEDDHIFAGKVNDFFVSFFYLLKIYIF
jgi:acyl transferase domain-containing protein